jgi:hypothetical protein
MPAIPFLAAYGVASGTAAAIGTALLGATVLPAVATAVGAGIISAGLNIASGKSVSDSLKGAVIGGLTSFIGAGIAGDVTSSIVEAAGGAGASSIATSLANVAGSMAGGAASGAIRATLTGQDPIEALIKGGLTAGLTTGVMEGIDGLTKEIPGFTDLKKDYGEFGVATQRAISAGLAAGVLGQDVNQSIMNSVLGSIGRNTGSASNTSNIKDLSGTLRPTYNNAEAAATKLQTNIDQQQQIVSDYNTSLAEAQALQAELQTKYDKYVAASDAGSIDEANALAEEINSGVPTLEQQTANLKTLESQLEAYKKQYTYLENSYAVKKSLLDESVSNYQTQEEANAQAIKQAFDDALAAKTSLEETFGSELTQEQLDSIVKSGNPKQAAEDLKRSLEGADDAAKKSVLDKLTEGVDSAVKYANENIVKTLIDAGLKEKEIDTTIGLDSNSAGQARSLFANSQGALDKVADTTADTSDDYMADFLKSVGINTTDELRDSGLSNEDILRRINYTLEEGGDLDDWYKKIEDTTGLDEGPVIPNPIDTTGLDEGPVIPTNDEDKGEVIIKGGRESCPVGTRLNLETGECDPYWDETGGNNPYWDETGGDETDPTRDEGEVTITGGRDTCPPGTILNPMTGECDPYWDETGGDETDPTRPEPTKPGPSTPRPTTPRPTTPRPTTPRPTTPTAPPTAAQPVAKQPAAQQIVPALLGMPELANVFYYGKDFSSQKQELDPTGQLVPQEYDPLSVTQRGPELQLDKMDGTNENDVQALIQQIMASNNGNISPEELAQILGQQGNMYAI